jgi:hypothetical protein
MKQSKTSHPLVVKDRKRTTCSFDKIVKGTKEHARQGYALRQGAKDLETTIFWDAVKKMEHLDNIELLLWKTN